jgi:hypothetical protein
MLAYSACVEHRLAYHDMFDLSRLPDSLFIWEAGPPFNDNAGRVSELDPLPEIIMIN